MSIFRPIALTLLLASLPLAASAEAELKSADLVRLMPVVKTLEADLKLNAEQEKALLAWQAEAPRTRQRLEARLRAVQQRMHEAILNDEPRLVREKIKAELLVAERQLIELTSVCVRMLRNTLDAEQFGTVVTAYRATKGS